MEQQNKIALGVVALVALAAGIFLLVKKTNSPSVSGEFFDTQVKFAEQNLDSSLVPPAFPTDLPLEQGILLENKVSENQVPNTGTFEINAETQSVRKFLSDKSVEENFALYEEYFAQQGWEVVNRLDEPDIKVLMAKKSGLEKLLKVTISKNALTGDVSVEISATE